MTIFDLVSAVVEAINADVAAGNTSFSVAVSPDNTQIVLTSSVANPAVKTEVFTVTNPSQPA
jgi:hypothetical protein